MAHAVISRWGKNLAVRLPGEVARAARLSEGEHVEIEARGSEIVLRRGRPQFSLDELFRGRTPKRWREAYADAYDWGPELGCERVED
jgi:antitoxin component of MazEF toxin-antitoxin module